METPSSAAIDRIESVERILAAIDGVIVSIVSSYDRASKIVRELTPHSF
jgi:hypothetical protein